MLVGQYLNAIDDKGRMLIPSKFRSEIAGDYVVVAPGIDNCLRLYTQSAWSVAVNEITAFTSTLNDKHRSLIRAIISPASECEIDKSGRILIPLHLRQKAAIEKEVLVVGSIEYIELWDPLAYEKWQSGCEAQIASATEELSGYLEQKKRGEQSF